MPRQKESKSLRKAAILALAQHWDKICYGCDTFQQMNALVESEEYLKVESPFQNFPSSFLEDLLEVIGSTRSLSRKFFHLLLLQQLRSLNLGFGVGEIYHGLFFLRRCKSLQTVNFSYLRHIEPFEFLKIIPYMGQLVTINLHMTLVMDDILLALSKHCPNLCDLNLTSTLVSDNGLQALSGMGLQSPAVPKCQKLKRLLISDTRVTWVGALHALQHFPELNYFDFDRIFTVFEHLDSEDEGKLRLGSLYSTANCVRPDSISRAAKRCPDTEILSLIGAWMDNELLYKFMLFERLRSLTIVNSGGVTVDYDEGILPLLQICGPKLENLILTKFKSIELISLGRSCPKLKKMALSNIDEYLLKEDERPTTDLFTQLFILELWFDARTEYSTSAILFLLLSSAKNLTNLLLKKSGSISLEFLRKIWTKNPMKELSRLTLDECGNVTLDMLEAIMLEANDLSVLRIWSCEKITQNERQALQVLINDYNFDVYLEWFK